MNPFGKYRCLRDNAKSALLAAIEIYNKPQLQYRNECFTILLVNAWELAIKGQLSRQRVRIFYPKERDKPYLTLSLRDALEAVRPHFPTSISYRGVAANLESLIDFRNNAIHFYNEPGLDVLLYGLAQTSVVNFRDFFQECFDKDIAEEVNLSLMPLSFRAPPDPIEFIRDSSSTNNKFLAAYLRLISDTTKELEAEGIDTGRFLTVFTVNLQSTKKIESADVIAGVQTDSPEGILLVDRRIDPNKTHPLRQKDILERIGQSLKGERFTSHTFQAIVWDRGVKQNPTYCWKADHAGSSPQYSNELVVMIKAMTAPEIRAALENYRNRQD